MVNCSESAKEDVLDPTDSGTECRSRLNQADQLFRSSLPFLLNLQLHSAGAAADGVLEADGVG